MLVEKNSGNVTYLQSGDCLYTTKKNPDYVEGKKDSKKYIRDKEYNHVEGVITGIFVKETQTEKRGLIRTINTRLQDGDETYIIQTSLKSGSCRGLMNPIVGMYKAGINEKVKISVYVNKGGFNSTSVRKAKDDGRVDRAWGIEEMKNFVEIVNKPDGSKEVFYIKWENEFLSMLPKLNKFFNVSNTYSEDLGETGDVRGVDIFEKAEELVLPGEDKTKKELAAAKKLPQTPQAKDDLPF